MRRAASPPTRRPLWLITLADLSLLLVGFFVFLQATANKTTTERAAIQAGIRQAFGGEAEPRLAVESNVIAGFAPGSAVLPSDAASLSGWLREALADSRTRLVLTGYADGSHADRVNGSALALAGLRAEAVMRALPDMPPQRVRLAAAIAPGAPRVTLAISYDP